MTAPTFSSLLHTASGAHRLDITVARTFWQRLRGLMLAPRLASAAGLLLCRCDSVHCAFMRQPIDVLYLDAGGVVRKCVPGLKPWRASISYWGRDARGERHRRACHTLELADGAIARLAIAPGDRLEHPALEARAAVPTPAALPASGPGTQGEPAPATPSVHPSGRARPGAQRGSSIVEFAVVGPLLTLLGLAVLQYGMLFFAKNQINHASFMAARAGSTGNANLAAVQTAYAKALVPLYGGGTDAAELASALVKASADTVLYSKVELLNPTKESFDDWNDAQLQAKYQSGTKRVIPNGALAFKGQDVGSDSGQTIQDANLLKLRIMHGYAPKVPIVAGLFSAYLRASDPRDNAYYSTLVAAGRIPVVTSVTLHMQSDAIEGTVVSTPGAGNGGTPVNPGDPPVSTSPPPTCHGIGCSTPDPVDPTDPGTPCTGTNCPVCTT